MFCLAAPFAADAANYPLEITVPRTNLSVNHRWLKAYPGLPYNVRAAVIGGAYPYVYSLSNAPSGMTINAATGEIHWPNPVSTAAPVLTVRDSEGTQVSASWTINVTATGFRFIDAVNGRTAANGGTGTQANPWRTIADMRAAAGVAGAITYFRAGTYTPIDLPISGPTDPPESRVEFSESQHSVIWLAYPGDARPVIDYGHTPGAVGTPRFRLMGTNIYLDGLETTRSHIMAFQIGYSTALQGATIRRCFMHHGGPGLEGSNAAHIMTIQTAGGGYNYGMFVADNQFYDTGVMALKTYDQDRLLVADNILHTNTGAEGGGIAIKGAHGRWEIRGNYIYDWTDDGIGGNMNGAENGEIRFNRVINRQVATTNPGPTAAIINYHGTAGPIYIYRNTLVGRIQFRFAEPSNGPFRVYNNVVVNNDGSRTPPYFYYGMEGNGVNDPSRIVLTDNLLGTPANGIVDANGDLTSGYLSFLGTRGYQLGTGGSPPPPPPPPPPSGSRCDIDASSSTNVVDVQLCVNQVLGTSGCTTGDIDLNGSCNVVDVQRVVNAALGGTCVTP